jgi:hypothetical protein
MFDHPRLAAGIELARRLARGRLEFDDVGAVILRPVDHDAALARHDPSLSRSARRLRCSSLRSNCVTAAVSWRVSLLRSRAHYLGTVEAGGFPLWMAAFNAKDALAMQTRWLHFPHVRFHSGTVTIMARPQEFHSSVWDREGEAKEWARTAWDYVECIDAGPDKVHFRVQFTRFRADGSPIGSYKSFYIVTHQNGRWGIQGRSSWANAG